MKKTIFTIITIFAMFFFMNDVKAITCNYEFNISGKKVNVSITEKFKNENCDIKCNLAHNYSFKYDGKKVSNKDAKFSIGGKEYNLKFTDFTVPSQSAGLLKQYIENTTRTCPTLYYKVSNNTNYTISNSSSKNKLTTLTKPKENTATNSCTYYYDANGKKLPYPITIENRTNNGTYMVVNGEEIYYQSKQPKEFKNGDMTYRYALIDKVDLSNGCNKISGTLTEQGNLTIFTVSNGNRGNYIIYNENPKSSSGTTNNGGNNGEGAGLNANNDCSLLGPETTAWLKGLLGFIQVAGPIVAIVLGMIDFVSAMLSSEDGAIKKAWGKFIRRAIAAALLIILPIIVELILDVTNITGNGTCI